MFKLHQNIQDWYYWYSPRLRKWCALRKSLYMHNMTHMNEFIANKYISKGALKKAIEP